MEDFKNINASEFFTKYKPKIIKLLEEKLVKPEGGLGVFYDDLEGYFNHAKNDWNNQNKDKYEKNMKSGKIEDIKKINNKILPKEQELSDLTIDLPVFLNNNKKETLIICAQDPLPQKKDRKFGLDFWVPFSIIKIKDPNVKGFNSNNVFFDALLKKYNIYLTDIYKVFFYSNKNNGKNGIIKDNVFHEILREEVEIIKCAKAIITLGNDSRNSLYKGKKAGNWNNEVMTLPENENDFKIPIHSIPHISGNNNGRLKKIIRKNGYMPKVDINKSIAEKVIEKL